MQITGSVALVTGANRGIGRAIAEQLLERGAAKVYAAARRPESVDLPGVEPLRLDITDPEQVAAAAAAAPDLTLLVNNAGISLPTNLVSGELADIRREVDTHLWGTLAMVRALAPVLAANGGGAIANLASALSWFAVPGATGYHVGKAAQWAMSNGIRLELAEQGTSVTSVHLGAADTDMMAGYEGPLLAPAEVATAVLDGVEAGAPEVLVDEWSRQIKAALPGDATAFAMAALAGLRGEGSEPDQPMRPAMSGPPVSTGSPSSPMR
ncbi:SDR family oxidoreductase [Homoserinibacter sp. YIM 151385]|uniref:SDR family oxidoreductase n=1 Tax=Homoserinibacter sp. YIM 151385 TaxID=2985506 RepID=UPI0022F06A90|nr:SDR family oxidoreductase [Homoserinibacter sp. YIM 151385]WBU36816.1 SDR family oxidoreductase [Homoserinibacter sp. YIM 151385]